MGLEIILHIGRHKSGTSSLQAYLHQQTDRYHGQGILYPRAGRTVVRRGKPVLQIAHHQLALSFLDADRIGAEARQRLWLDELRRELVGQRRMILSSESFGNMVQERQIRALKVFLEELQPERIVVVAYLREYLDYINSGYRQRIQNSGDLVRLADYPLLRIRGYSLAAWLAAWRSLGAMICRHFSREALHQGDVIADFCLHAAIDHHSVSEKMDHNPSIGGNLLFLKCALNHLARHRTDLYTRLAEHACRNAAYRLPLAISADAARRIRASSDWNTTMENLFGSFPLPNFECLPACPEPATLEEDLNTWSPLLESIGTDRQEIVALIPNAATWFRPYPYG